MPLSEPEQAAFFAEYGSQLESMLHRGFSQVDERLRRLEFFHDSSLPLYSVELLIELKAEFSPKQLGHFRVMAELIDLHEPEPHPTLWMACCDAYPVYVSSDRQTPLVGTRSLGWSRHPDEKLQDTVFSAGQLTTRALSAGVGIHKRGPFRTLGDLDRKTLSIYVTAGLVDKIAAIYVSANEYYVAGTPSEMFVQLDSQPLASWPEPLPDAGVSEPWVCVMLKWSTHQNGYQLSWLARAGESTSARPCLSRKRTGEGCPN